MHVIHPATSFDLRLTIARFSTHVLSSAFYVLCDDRQFLWLIVKLITLFLRCIVVRFRNEHMSFWLCLFVEMVLLNDSSTESLKRREFGMEISRMCDRFA